MQINSLTSNASVPSAFNPVQTDLARGFDKVISDAIERGAGNDFITHLFKNSERFVELAEMASQQQPSDSKRFLKNLSYEDREVLKEVHSIADYIDDNKIDQMTTEGANNLLRLPRTGLDSDNDGFTDIGIGRTFMFPNSNTPAGVTEAWSKTTEGMSFKDKMMAESHFMIELITANIELDDNGRFVTQHEPGSPGYENPFASAGFSYQEWSQNWLQYVEDFKSFMSADQYATNKEFFDSFLQNLQETNTA